ncbi:MAG: isoprenyl transferase [Thiotrichales bacterium]|nr:isoprenyl transferase [Thiotrichales bacterium]
MPDSEPTTSRPLSNPKHVAIIMDGNGRWANQRNKPRVFGHRQGVKTLRKIVELCVEYTIPNLTVYAFSSENWQRPAQEVNFLMELFISSLQQQIDDLNKNNIKVNFIGDRTAFPEKLVELINSSADLTASNTGLQLNVAANYGGRWDITHAVQHLVRQVDEGKINTDNISEAEISRLLCLGDLPEPDLFIRTGGEQRISNYLLWQLAYTELYFTECLWPDFNTEEFNKALDWYRGRERRFGKTSEQLAGSDGA